jgi:hypothetical protein
LRQLARPARYSSKIGGQMMTFHLCKIPTRLPKTSLLLSAFNTLTIKGKDRKGEGRRTKYKL